MNETFQIAILMGDLSVIFRILKVFFFFQGFTENGGAIWCELTEFNQNTSNLKM